MTSDSISRSAPTVADAIFAAVADDTRPLLTYYHDATGERTELSSATLRNWAAKTANFLLDEAGLVAGDTVVVDLPEHWQTVAILCGAWWAGADVHLRPDDAAGHISAAFTTVDGVDRYPDADETVVASMDAFALPVSDLPIGVADFGSAVRVHGDIFTAAQDRSAAPALDGVTTTAVVADAVRRATGAGVSTGDRVLSTRGWRDHDGLVGHLLAPLIAGASLVFVSAPSADFDARAATERATIIWT